MSILALCFVSFINYMSGLGNTWLVTQPLILMKDTTIFKTRYVGCLGLEPSLFFIILYELRRSSCKPAGAHVVFAFRKHAHSNILKILPQKKWKFSDKNSDIFHISAQNIDCGYSLEPPRPLEPPRRGGSNEYPQSMFLSRYKKNNVYPCKPQFYYIKVGFKGVKII